MCRIIYGIVLSLLSVGFSEESTARQKSIVTPSKMNGVSYVAPPKQEPDNPFVKMEVVNANWVCIMPYAFVAAESPRVRFNEPRQWWGERSEGVIKSIELAREAGLTVMLKPHVWVRRQGWTGDFYPDNEEDWETWATSYENYILTMAKIADSMSVELFCVGLEFKTVIDKKPRYWPQLIEKIRTVYRGKLTYGANWDNFENITFWDKLDYIGIHAYFPLSQKETPTVGNLMKAWQNPYNLVKEVQKKYEKPVLFTEYGYRSIDSAAGKQWELPNGYRYEGPANMKVQQNAYEAFYERFWKEPWVAGGFFWKWHGNHEKAGGAENARYTPQNKSAQEVIKKWYGQR